MVINPRLQVPICMDGYKKCILGKTKIKTPTLKHITQEIVLTIHNTVYLLYYILYLIL
jgi:hypothetical protein